MDCAICGTRRPRRFCPGINGNICTVCCGEEREVTVDCPLDCEFLIAARKHEKLNEIVADAIPNSDIQPTRKHLEANEELLMYLVRALVTAALSTHGVVDFDVRDALDGLIRTYRTLESGMYYESVPANAIAANLFRHLQQAIQQFRADEHAALGLSKTRDSHVLVILVYLQRIELDRNNGRRRGRAFLHAIKDHYEVPEPAAPSTSSLLLP
jgi:hypothetical protein